MLIEPSAPPRSRSPSPTEGFTIPNELECPITRVLFRNPVVAADGITYERQAIVQWVKQKGTSPTTRETLSLDKLLPNRFVKDRVDDFRAECRRKKLLYKYKLDVDIKKTEQIPYIKINTKSIYRAELIKNNSSLSTDSNVILIHLTGENAEKIADSNCHLELHPNIVQIFGRVEHNDTGILLVQERPVGQTLSELIKTTDQKLSITHVDIILHQIACALQHLANAEIIHENVTADNVVVYRFNDIPENTWVKLYSIDNTDKIPAEVLSKNLHSEKPDVYAFGLLARELYDSLDLAREDKDLIKRQALYEHCLVLDPHDHPTFNELTKAISDIIHEEKNVLKCSSSV